MTNMNRNSQKNDNSEKEQTGKGQCGKGNTLNIYKTEARASEQRPFRKGHKSKMNNSEKDKSEKGQL